MSAATSPRRDGDDRRRTLITAEGIALPLVLASRGARFGALALDLVFIGLFIILATIAAAFAAGGLANLSESAGAGTSMGHALEFLFILWMAAMFLARNAWFMAFELGPRGATPGKRLTGVRIAARGGGKLSAEMVIARNLLRDVELFLPIVFLLSASDGGDMGAAGIASAAWFLVFALFPLFNRDRLRAGDLIAGTWVVEAPRRKLKAAMSTRETAHAGQSTATGATYRFGEAELAIYGEYELQTLERVLREDRPEALVAVAEAICRKIGWSPGEGDERAFLDAYYTQLRARLEAQMRFGKRKADKHDPGKG